MLKEGTLHGNQKKTPQALSSWTNPTFTTNYGRQKSPSFLCKWIPYPVGLISPANFKNWIGTTCHDATHSHLQDPQLPKSSVVNITHLCCCLLWMMGRQGLDLAFWDLGFCLWMRYSLSNPFAKVNHDMYYRWQNSKLVIHKNKTIQATKWENPSACYVKINILAFEPSSEDLPVLLGSECPSLWYRLVGVLVSLGCCNTNWVA